MCTNYIFEALETFVYAGEKSMGGCSMFPVFHLLQESEITPFIRLVTYWTRDDQAFCPNNYASE